MNLVILMYSSKYMEENENFDYFKCITWSPYERIDVKPVTSFKELCKGGNLQNNDQEKAHIWTGVKQSLHLIGLDSERHTFNLTDNNKGNYVFNVIDSKKNEQNYNFYCVLSMRFTPDIHKMYNEETNIENEQHIKEIKKKAVNIISSNLPEDTVYASFRSLGAEDMVMVFLSNSIKSIMKAVDISRNIQIKYNNEIKDLFSTVYMFTGLNDPDCIDEIGVPIIVNLHLKHHNIDVIKNEIESKLKDEFTGNVEYKEIFRGKGTLQLEIPGSIKTDILFKHKEGILNEGSDFHKNNFYNSRVYFKEEFEADSYSEPIDLGIGWHTENEQKDTAGKSQNKSNYMVGNDEKMSEVAKFIFGEYERMEADDRFCQWKSILKEHHETTLTFVKQYMKYNRLTECKLLEQMQSSLHLINQACSPVSDIPYHNYYYSGSFSDLLKAYYGIINMLFNIIYDFPRSEYTLQHKIVFAVRLEAIARIQSEMYTLKDSTERIIIFSLPYDSFWNYANNIRLLSHEAFHYAAPYDRTQRNKDILNIIFKILLLMHSQKISEKYSRKQDMEPYEQETREWNLYMLNAYENDTEIREKLYGIIYDKYSQFFTTSAPEWNNIFCKNKYLDRVIRLTADSVEEFIEKNADSAKKHIIEKLKTFKLSNAFAKSKIEDPGNIICNEIITTISTFNTAVKEAFCDIWSIKITKTSVKDYISWLFNVMVDINDLSRLFDTFGVAPGSGIKMFSLPIRLYLLLYYDFIEKGSKTFNPAKVLRECTKHTNDNNVEKCINDLANYIDLHKLRYSFCQNELYDMAFGNLRNYFSQTQFTEKTEVRTLGEIYQKDLAADIGEESLNRIVYYYWAPKYRCDDVTVGRDECIKAFGSGYSSVMHDYCYENNTPFMISSLSDYIMCLNEIYKLNKSNLEKHGLWYRGICSIKYSLLPSLFRHCDKNLSLYANQSNIIKQAYFNSTASTEVWNQPIQQKMASLQHYGVPTNLLDFSLDQFVALHFAINPDREEDRKKIDDGHMRPVVYVFNPIVYSSAIEILRSGNPQKTKAYKLSPVLFDINQNAQECAKYFVSDISYDYLVKHTKLYNSADYIPNPRTDMYPMPMVIEHTNQRIKAQSGVFVAYPLDAQPQKGKDDESRYHYMDLMQIQTNYNNLVKASQIDAPFLFTIEVRKESVSLIRHELEQLRINSGKYYPELSKLFENM